MLYNTFNCLLSPKWERERERGEMADAAITFLLEDLIRILSEKAYLLSGVKEEVKSLESQLKLTQSYIRDFRPRRNDQIINIELINKVTNQNL